jgi:hypothetical protein
MRTLQIPLSDREPAAGRVVPRVAGRAAIVGGPSVGNPIRLH